MLTKNKFLVILLPLIIGIIASIVSQNIIAIAGFSLSMIWIGILSIPKPIPVVISQLPDDRAIFIDLLSKKLKDGFGGKYFVLLLEFNREEDAELVSKLIHFKLAASTRDSDILQRVGIYQYCLALAADEDFRIESVCKRIISQFRAEHIPKLGFSAVSNIVEATNLFSRLDDSVSCGIIFDDEKIEESPPTQHLVEDLYKAIDREQLRCYFQPKRKLNDLTVAGFELLLRWEHPELGLIQPIAFIPLAESTGLIDDLTAFVIESAVSQQKIWKELGYDLPIAVNVSPANLTTSDLIHTIANVLTEDFDPGKLVIEVTETVLMSDRETSLKILVTLDEMGTKLSIDDFGTGHSSLIYLKHLPIYELKIDKSFIMDMMSSKKNHNIVRSTIEFAHANNCNVVAEGVENAEIFHELQDLGCDTAQGYYISQPMSVEAATEWLGDQRKNGKV